MRKRFFIDNLIRVLAFSLLPLLLLSTLYLAISVPEQRTDIRENTQNNLTLIKENVTVLLNDTSKVMNMLEASTNTSTLRKIFSTFNMDYREYITHKNILAHLSAIVNSRSYINSIYIYIPSDNRAYLTSNGNLYKPENSPDPDWIKQCESDSQYHMVRRSIPSSALGGKPIEYVSVVEKNENGSMVAINISVSYFRQIFASLNLKPEQVLMIADGDSLICASDETALELFNAIDQTDYLVVKDHSATLGIDFISALPRDVAYASMNRFISLLITITLVCMLICVGIALLNAVRTSRRLYQVIDLIDAATSNRQLPEIKNPRNDIYGYIMTNIVQTFVENDYLQLSLDERKFQAISLELSALQYQINPHFLSNTLQIIDFEVMRAAGGTCQANAMIEQLSDFLQYSLKNPNQDVTIAQEKEATELYISLMQVRFINRFSVAWKVDRQALEIKVPKLILQPIIENAVAHGFLEIPDAQMHISIDIRLQGEQLMIAVQNNGVGVDEKRLEEIRHSLENFEGFNEKHIGLPNLIRRIRLRFGDQARADIQSPPEGGFAVVLFIPVN